MNLMEFKIAVIGQRMFGDLGLIINDPKRPPQVEKGFFDNDLTGLLTKNIGDNEINGIYARDR